MNLEGIHAMYDGLNKALVECNHLLALEKCEAILALVADTGLEAVRKQLRNMVKDQNIENNIRLFIENDKKDLPPREEAFCPEVVIPCFNHGRFLGDALASIPEGVPVTLINDASTDDTVNYIAALHKRFSFNLLTNEVNLNQAGSINRAVRESSNNLFIILNADDALINYAIPAILSVFDCYESIRMVGGNCYPFSQDEQLERNRELPKKLPYSPVPKIYCPSDALCFRHPNDLNMTMSSCSFLRSAWEAAGGFWEFDQRVCSFDDRDFQMRVCSLFPVAILQEPLAFYRVNSSVGRGRSV